MTDHLLAPLQPFAETPALDAAGIGLVVIVPTYRRPEPLLRTLASLERQRFSGRQAVVVVENHAAGMEGARAAAGFVASARIPVCVVVEARQGNCSAYNAGFRFASARFPGATHFAIIDDDEAADENWLAMLLATARAASADIVGGPQVPEFEDKQGEAAYGRHPVFQPTHQQSGPVPLIHSTGNCLIAAKVVKAMGDPLLDEAFNFTGGGDTDFFTRCAARGFTFAWCNEAIVRESVPPRRTERSWVTARSLRNGMLSALIQRRAKPGLSGRIAVIGKSLALLAAAPFRSAALALRTGSLYAGSYHLMIAAGRIMAEFGYAQEQYRKPEKN